MNPFFMVAEVTPPTLAGFLTDAGSVLKASLGWVGDVASTVGATPILLVPVVIAIAGLGIGLYKSLR